jgi:pyruvate kinase
MTSDLDTFRALRADLGRLRKRLSEAEVHAARDLESVHAAYRESACNLIHYLTARQIDLRPLQLELWRRGLSSLGRIEGHVGDALDQVLARLDESLSLAGDEVSQDEPRERRKVSCDAAEKLLHRHTRDLFGPKPAGRHVHVMVTAPDARAVDDAWVSSLLDAGVTLLRVNGAHEEAPEWRRIVETARRVATERGASLRILFDLPGRKLRTVAPGPGPRVERWKPERDDFGRVVMPCRVQLRLEGTERRGRGPSLEIPARTWPKLTTGDELVVNDTRGKARHLVVTELGEHEGFAYLNRTAYVVPEARVRLRRAGVLLDEFRVTSVEEQPFRIELSTGDRLRLAPASRLEALVGGPLPVIGCSLSELLMDLKEGARVLFDDGKIECEVEERDPSGVVLRVTHAPRDGARLGAEKGINVPDTPLRGAALSPDDEHALAFAVANADMVGASFVRDAEDVRAVYRRLDQLGARGVGVVLKIETPVAFARLPAILLAAMSRYPVGVMIARGDLAVEAGFERLAELQEEILWLCEAAHLPVIWATQVLDRLAHTGTATRAEVTDAAMAVRAECVMLNKGPYIADAVSTLVDILRRMESHQYKKRNLYRRLSVGLSPLPPAEREPELGSRAEEEAANPKPRADPV